MSDYQTPPASPPASRLSLWQVWLGMALYGPLNLLVLWSIIASNVGQGDLPTGNLGAIAAIIGVTLAVAAGAYFLLRRRGCAAGILLGYVLLSLISGGGCTLLVSNPNDERVIAALVLYPGAIVLLGLGIAVYKFLKR